MINDINDVCFMDSETRRVKGATILDVTKVGGYVYAQQAFPVMWTTAIGEAPVGLDALHDGFHERLSWEVDASDDLKRFYDRAARGEAWFAAWNMQFDRLIWNGPESDYPPLEPYMCIDVMAQAAASGLPTKLVHAAEYLGAAKKLEEGKELIKMFEPPEGMTPQSHPEHWARYCEYGVRDTAVLREIYQMTRKLSRDEWEVYWASEAINDRGIALDRQLCAATSVLVDSNETLMNRQIEALTGGEVDRVTQVARILGWAEPVLRGRSAAIDPLIEKTEVLFEDGSVKRPEKLSLARERLEQVLVYFDAQDNLTPAEAAVRDVLELRQYGGSNTPKKFLKALIAELGGRLRGQYVFNGAPQTGRFSSRGVQTHNLTRSHLGDQEIEAIEAILDIEDPRVDKRLKDTAAHVG